MKGSRVGWMIVAPPPSPPSDRHASKYQSIAIRAGLGFISKNGEENNNKDDRRNGIPSSSVEQAQFIASLHGDYTYVARERFRYYDSLPISCPRVYATVCRMLPNLDADHEESTRCPLKNSTNETSLSLFDTISSRERKEAKLLLRSERRCSEVVAPKARGFQTSRIKRRRSRCAEERHPVRGATVSTGRNNWGYRYLAARLSRLAPPPPPRDGGEFLGKVSDSTGTN